MGHIFRIKKTNAASTKDPTIDWSDNAATTYNSGYVSGIQDATTTQNEITSIPSPFARIELVKEAFAKVTPKNINGVSISQVLERLHGNTIYHKMVSDSLDVGQIFFSYPRMKDKVDILVWDKDVEIKNLLASTSEHHSIVGRTLSMFFQQDSLGNDPYNFSKMQKLYILKYKGVGQSNMHIIGATSPATLFFSTANDESAISRQLCFGSDYAFDGSYASLDQRDEEYLKYLYAFRYSNPRFNSEFPEFAKYLDAVYYVLNNDLKNEINQIQSLCMNNIEDSLAYIEKEYDELTVDTSNVSSFNVEINGHPFHFKKAFISGNSDFQIAPTKDGKLKPLVLPVVKKSNYDKLIYYGSEFGRNINVPFYDRLPLEQRSLPDLNIPYPYLTISDFLEDRIVKLPNVVNSESYFDGNFTSSNGINEGYLLPIKELYFDYFTTEDLIGTAPSGKKTIEIKTLASAVEVTLRIPIQNNKEIEYKRIYTEDNRADETNNNGAIVLPPQEPDLAIGVLPPIEFNQEKDAFYRILILTDNSLYKGCNCQIYSDKDGFFDVDYVVRNTDIVGDITAKVFLLEHKTFNAARITLTSDHGKELKGSGLMIPKFKKRTGAQSLTFAIDLGTSNTHIEYTSGSAELPRPFDFTKDQPQLSLLFNTDSATVMDHIRAEFIPEAMGENALCRFPLRTVLCIDKINSGHNELGTGAYEAFGNASPAFMYNQKVVGTKYNNYIPNLKWDESANNSKHINSFIESLFMMIRAKVIQEGASISQTKIIWFYPISMSNHKKDLFETLWKNAYHKYFNPSVDPTAITESIAPYSFFQRTRSDVTDIVTIDIGGGTTDIVVADTNGVRCVSSMRFAANSIFGNSLVSVQDGELNGIIRQCKAEFISKLEGDKDLQNMFIDMTKNDFGNSAEVASFLFSLVDNVKIREKKMQDDVNFNAYLTRDNSQKIVFFIFFTSIIYHLAHLMKAKGLPIPANIAFSGNGSKVISVLSPNAHTLERLTSLIFKLIYNKDLDRNIQLIMNSENPKEATCKGGLFLKDEPENLDIVKSILINVKKETLAGKETYEEVPRFYNEVVQDVKEYINFIALTLPNQTGYSLNKELGIDKKYLNMAVDCFNKNLLAYVEKGVDLKLKTGDVGNSDTLEETLFFYPIIGVLNDLSNTIFDSQVR